MKRTAPDQPDSNGGAASEAAPAQRLVVRPAFTIRHMAACDCEFQSHAHTAFTATVVLAGELRATVGAQEARVPAGGAALTNVSQPHAGGAERVEFVSMQFAPEMIAELATELGLTKTSLEIVFRAPFATDETLARLARQVVEELNEERPGRAQMLDALARQAAIHLLRAHLAVRRSAHIELSRAGMVDRRLRRALEFMHDNYARELAVEEIAAAAYVSEYHFARLFKQITGVTPHVYLANLRVEKARRLLAETALPIIEIAALVGYQSQSHFTKVFKAVTGATPRAFRDSLRKDRG